MNDRTITTALTATDTRPLLASYRLYRGDSTLTENDLYLFLTTPTPEREEYLVNHCTCSHTIINNIVSPIYTAQ